MSFFFSLFSESCFYSVCIMIFVGFFSGEGSRGSVFKIRSFLAVTFKYFQKPIVPSFAS